MKKPILTTAVLMCALTIHTHAQTFTETFENLSLPANSFYKDTTGADWQTTNAIFRYSWDTGWSYWSEGTAYTNINDSTNGNYTNLYGCIAYKGYNNSNYYVTGQNFATIVLKSPYQIVDGFYITNTTYAAKVMKYGNMFSRAFGDTTGTGCNCPQGSYPDWFKVTIKGYKNGSMLNDSVEFYLADYRFSNNSLDYIVWNWQWVDCSSLGTVDSIQFYMYSSDVGVYGINTPTYFSMDNFTTSGTAGIHSLSDLDSRIFPNPVKDKLSIQVPPNENYKIQLFNMLGQTIAVYEFHSTTNAPIVLNFEQYEKGAYLMLIENNNSTEKHLIIKQ